MARTKERLYVRFRGADGKQSTYFPALYDKKSRLRSGWCLVRGAEEYHPDGFYYQRVKREGKWVWEARGASADVASRKSSGVTTELALRECWQTLKGKDKPEPTSAKRPDTSDTASVFRVEDEIDTYLENVAKLAPKTYKAYKLTLNLFRESCSKLYMHQITKQDLQAFDTFLMERDCDDRTRHNRIGYIVTFLRNKEGRRSGSEILNISIKVKYVESQPEAYTRQELDDLFRVSCDEDRFVWRFFLGTGFREGEASVAEKSDINPDTKTIRLDEKPWYGFRPKDCEKRSVPISDALLAEIEARVASKSCSLLFPTSDGRPDGHLLRRLKRLAFKGGLNCGKCIRTLNGEEVTCVTHPVCEKWILHRFRKNFATDRHNAGAAARKIQRWLGHSDLETTLRYLAIGDDTTEEIRSIVNGVHVGL